MKIDSEYFVTRHDAAQGPTGCILRFLYYPSVSNPATSSYQHGVDVRAGAHSDYGTLTLLFQRPGQPGLEILSPDDGSTWSPVPVWPDGASSGQGDGASFPPILINIGDMLSFWTNGLLRSTVHRVVFPAAEQGRPAGQSQDRYSVVFFCQPVDDCNLVPPVPSPLVAAAAASSAQAENEKVGFGGGALLLGQHKSLTAKQYLDMRLLATYGHREEIASA
jgi:isopenicillin N synthase-like dioxygenase